jgi:carbamoyl-phosphate synthase (ammonia)
MIRNLVDRNCEVHQVPWNHDYSKMTYDGLFLSNGPGDPAHPEMVGPGSPVEILRKVIKQSEDVPDSMAIPIFGICMGNQILGSAVGCTTYKMQFGNRGQNQPVTNHVTNECYVTPQNHGFAIDTTNLPAGWNPLFTNTNDGTNEGIAHESKPWCTAQFHPEARSGPTDTGFLFDLFVKNMQERKSGDGARSFPEMFRQHDESTRGGRLLGHAEAAKIAKDAPPVKKILMLGSGGLSIGQAGEFDYSGSQAIKAFKEEGAEVVLINPNIASVQTNDTTASDFQADTVYFLPVTHDYVEEILKRERPCGIVLSMGGQTGLNTGVELYERGTLDKYNCRVLGTSVTAIMNTEDRDRFSVRLNEINESMAPSVAVEPNGKWQSSSLSNPAAGELADGVEAAVAAAKDPVHGIGFPCMIRSAYALGGLGSGICTDEAHMREMVPRAFASSPQILVEKSMLGWKEVEYEVVRDINDNCVTVCNMENFDPLGVHTGDSIVIAPSQTLDNDEYHMLRETSIKVVRHLGIVGECNIQYALHPTSKEYCIIEVNPRLSRSSALASKATGYPLAFVAAKLALGHDLSVLRNSVTHTTTACFEPSLDYVVVKVPRWDLKKFDKVSRAIGSGMKSIGEVMAVGRSFEESFQKALRMTDPAISGFDPIHYNRGDENIIDNIYPEHDARVHALAAAFAKGMTVDELHDRTKIDKWYLHKLEKISSLRHNLTQLQNADQITNTSMRGLKRSGFSDAQIARLTATDEDAIRQKRKGMGILPVVKQIDTMAAEFPAATNYLYMTYNGDEHDVDFEDKGSIVLGSGVYRIGSSVEFDWCSVSAIRTLRRMGRKSVMVNYNPETVSTDYDECDRLYFEELSLERVQDIYEAEQAENLMVSVGGQIPNTLAMDMGNANINILGTTPDMIDRAEDRNRFSAMCDEYGIDQPQWASLTDQQAAFDFCDRVGYPVLVRPSYVLSGAAMAVAYNAGELMSNLQNAAEVSTKYPVVISEFIEGGREIDVDAVAHNGKVIPGALAIAEHVENAGVHSGDATLMIPPQTLTASDIAKTRETIDKVAEALNITGPFNMQLIAKDGSVKIIETNLRASRSAPFSSKTIGTDLIEVATKAMLHQPGDPPIEDVEGLINFEVNTDGTEGDGPYVGIKSPMFSWKRLLGADPTLGVEMASTGEVACYGRNKHESFLLSLLSTTFPMPEKKKVLVSIEKTLRSDFTRSLELLHEQDYEIYATEKTAEFINEQTNIPVTMLHWLGSNQSPSIEEVCRNKEIDLCLMFANSMSVRTEMNYDIRRLVSDFNIPLITNLQVAELFAEATQKLAAGEIELEPLHLKEHYARAGRPL